MVEDFVERSVLYQDGEVVGEVVETSLTTYFAQTLELDKAPPFGGLVRVRDKGGQCLIYGLVYHIATGGIDQGRRATVRSAGEVTRPVDEEVYTAHPQLRRLLRTEFGVLVLGCRKPAPGNGRARLCYIYPDYPPPLHYSVMLCPDEELVEFTANPLFLRTLLQASNVPSEELTAALLRRGAEARGYKGHDWLLQTGRHLARLLKEDYDRLRVILEKCEV